MLTYRNSTCQAFCAKSVTPYIAMLNGEPIGYAQSYVALGSGDGWWEEETDPGVRGIDQSLAMHHNWAKAWNQAGSALVELLFNDPEVTKIQTDRRRATCERSDATRKRGLRGKVP